MSSFLSPGTLIGNGKFVLGNKLGSGSHGDVYIAQSLESGKKLAIKLESWDSFKHFLPHEYRVYKYSLKNEFGFPKIKWFGQEQRHNIMAMDLLGSSLSSLLEKCGNKFSLKSVLMLTDQVLERVEALHSKHFIHRSIKPENFSIGKDDPSKIYMIDFGNAKRYRNKSGKHIKYKVYEELGLSNCHSRHQSIGALQRMERSRRDDLESVGYMLIYCLRGSLPWDTVMDDPVKLRKIKLETTLETLCEGCPNQFLEYMTHVRNLQFEESPNYAYLREMFKNLAVKSNIVYDGKFDWVETHTVVETKSPSKFKKSQMDEYMQECI